MINEENPEIEQNNIQEPTLSQGDAVLTSSPKREDGGIIASVLYKFAVLFGVVYICSIFFGQVLFFPMGVRGYSMQPNYNASAIGLNGTEHTDTVYVGKYSKFSLGDVVVFDSGEKIDGETQYYIKRIVGTPGDIISFEIIPNDVQHVGGRVGSFVSYVLKRNGVVVKEPYIQETMRCFYSDGSENGGKNYQFYKYYLLDGKSLSLGENEYFMMGDNRNYSTDSRYLGPFDKKVIVGRVCLKVEYGENIFKSLLEKIF